ncbi:ATP-binding protein [Actinosynnema sp. NPDC047251]|uniref:histidine kinase n=1 Tax=Saccharothrix espanaensis (strain ATCC 51144 / DSM 44229 / JCM 9112 / NBRC 15066 / NRRL 15764) TaxID=1179773 RepID=K0K9P9_SACES|nr:sensor histidine kinase [Saccharothrix espanaensis]CCH33353.1 putative histidine kinase [Saccharothrix espanaensis DSM 44229]
MDYRTRWPASRLLIASVTILIIVCAGAIGGMAVALVSLTDARTLLLDQVGPARRHALELDNALIDQENGVRGFALTASEDFLRPYQDGQRAEQEALRNVRTAIAPVRPDLVEQVDRIGSLAVGWRAGYAEVVIAEVRSAGEPRADQADAARGKELFDTVRQAVSRLQGVLNTESTNARTGLDAVADQVLYLVIALGVLLVVIIAGVAVVLHRILIRPLIGLAAQVRQVSSGDFAHEVRTGGPRETVMLGQDVDVMRARIVNDVEELRRSNSELEQFAYVASHDLQEPLRKVASFCQLLERRYSGQLDDRGEQYLRFAVDGAKRMQVLINDLLAFSRVGRMIREHVPVDLNETVAQVLDSYSEVIERTGATVQVPELPTVRGEASLLGGVFGNLIGNALKFHGEDPPRVRVEVERTGELWTFTVGDDGIGIEPEYAERIFVIFQRLHHKDDYPGTGIGLAMCRKIIEYHGGTIWLDTDQDAGTTFKFTLPAVEDTDE